MKVDELEDRHDVSIDSALEDEDVIDRVIIGVEDEDVDVDIPGYDEEYHGLGTYSVENLENQDLERYAAITGVSRIEKDRMGTTGV